LYRLAIMRHNRRQFIGELFGALIGPAALSRAASFKHDDQNDSLASLCVLTRQPGNLPNATVDIWTGQIGIVDIVELPEQLGKAVVWHDIRGATTLPSSIADIVSAIEEYFGFKPVLGSNAAAHVGAPAGLLSAIEVLFQPSESASPLYAIDRRVAVVDLGSCGMIDLHTGWRSFRYCAATTPMSLALTTVLQTYAN
jgi:hypothetical protein